VQAQHLFLTSLGSALCEHYIIDWKKRQRICEMRIEVKKKIEENLAKKGKLENVSKSC
jgi:uncharacterized membrane protein (DUF106 family)